MHVKHAEVSHIRKSLSKSKQIYSIPYPELDLLESLKAPNLPDVPSPYQWGPKCMHKERRRIQPYGEDNISRAWDNTVNYYVTKTKFWAAFSFAAFCFELFDNYSDVIYIFETDFNQQWMYYASVFIVIFPPLAYFAMAFKVI
jgi:hypothetical protein